jgi:hypothetical protein
MKAIPCCSGQSGVVWRKKIVSVYRLTAIIQPAVGSRYCGDLYHMPASTCLLVEPIGTKTSDYAALILHAGCFEVMVAHGQDEARRYVSEHSWLSTVIVDAAVRSYAELVRFVRRQSPNATIIVIGEADANTVPEATAIISRKNPGDLLEALRGR